MSAINYSDEDGHHSGENEDISGTLGETKIQSSKIKSLASHLTLV